MRCLSLFALPFALALAPSLAKASPWTLPKGTVVIGLGAEYQVATQETLQDSSEVRDYPLSGRFESQTLRLKLRAGFTSRLEMEMQLPIKAVQYHSDLMLPRNPDGTPVLITEEEDPARAGQAKVMNFNRHEVGPADLLLAARYRLGEGRLPAALQLQLKAPMGYDKPAGTVENGKVVDDVALGDGQLDVAASVLLGYAFPSRTFVRMDAGYRLRLGGAGDEVIGMLKLGQMLPGNVLVFVESRASYHVQQGDVLGTTVVTIDPDAPVSPNNMEERDRRLQRDMVLAGAGGLWRITPTVEMQVGYVTPAWSRNLAVTHTVYVSMGVRTDLAMED